MIRFACLIVLVILPAQIVAQGATQSVMTVQVEITSGINIDVEEMLINLDTDLLYGNPVIDPVSEEASVVRIAGSPGRQLLITLPHSIELHDNGNRILLSDMQYAISDSPGTESTELISPESCVEVEIPPSGDLYLRIGEAIFIEQYIVSGSFSGAIPLSVTCLD